MISVVIPTYQRCTLVNRLLHLLASQDFPYEHFEVIVSIDGSTDATQQMVHEFQAPYQLYAVWQPNRGRAAACNAGMRLAQGELLILLDDDMKPVPGFLSAHWRAHQNQDRLGVLGAVPILFDRSCPLVVQYVGAKFNRHLEYLKTHGSPKKLTDFYSGNFSIRRLDLLETGGFDESFEIYGNEDLDLYLRLLNVGFCFSFNRNALAYQDYTKDLRALAGDQTAKGKTAVLLASKHAQAREQLKLSTYSQASLKWRALRAALLGLSKMFPNTPEIVIRFVQWLERQHPKNMYAYYYLVFDFFYWLGAQAAQAEEETQVT